MLLDAPPPNAPCLVIVVPDALRAGLDEFVRHKQRRLSVEVLSLEAALGGADGDHAADDAEKLKVALFDRWKRPDAPSLTHVLLVGDADVLPVRYMVLDRCTKEAFNYAFYPSDLYYADLAKADGTFESWNAQAEGFHAGYFGEVRGECTKDTPINFDQIDYRPEIAVGRWPVSTPEQLDLVARKTIAYEDSLPRSAPGDHGAAKSEPAQGAPAPRRAALVAVGGWIENRPAMNELGAELTRASWDVSKFYWGGPQSELPTEDNVVGALNSGVRLLLHSGHGSDDRWDQSLGRGSLARLTNATTLPVVFSAGCSTARFATLPPYEAYVDVSGVEHPGTNNAEVFTAPPPPPACYQKGRFNPTGLGEQMVVAGPTGAVAYIGCNTGSQPCGMTLLAAFTDAAARGAPTVGECWSSAVKEYYERERLADLKPDEGWYPPSIFFQGMKFMLYGDPSAPMP